jgi:Holliday junction resolvase RusA-like endonuclease
MTPAVSFSVIGLPAPQGSKTRMPNGAMVEAASKTGRDNLRSWRDTLIAAARPHAPASGPIDEPLRVAIDFRFPATKSKPYRHHHASKPDVDKLVRATLDSLKLAGLIADDSLVCDLAVTKRYCRLGGLPSGADVVVHPLGLQEQHFAAERKRAAQETRRRPAVLPAEDGGTTESVAS